MANTILQKRSSTASAVPTTAQLALGQIALNTRDGLLFFKKDVSGTESIVTLGGQGFSLLAASNLSDLGNAGTARTNLGLGSMATQAAGGVAITGGAVDGVVIGGNAPVDGYFGYFAVQGAAGTSRSITLATGASARVTFGITSAAEGGGNAGSNFSIDTYSDAGAYLASPLTIARATGAVAMAGAVSAGSLAVGSPTGGNQGAGTVNATGLYVNGSAVSPSDAVAITGGAIDGTPIGATTASTLRGTTLALTTSQSASTVLAAPNGSSGAPSFRQLAASDITGTLDQKSITVTSPTASEKVPLFFTRKALTVVEIRSLVLGTSPSVTFSVRHGTDVSGSGTEVVTSGTTCTNTTTGLSTTSFNSASVAANSWVWLTTSAVSGTVSAMHVTVHF